MHKYTIFSQMCSFLDKYEIHIRLENLGLVASGSGFKMRWDQDQVFNTCLDPDLVCTSRVKTTIKVFIFFPYLLIIYSTVSIILIFMSK